MKFTELAAVLILLMSTMCPAAGQPKLRLDTDPSGAITFLSWDTEGGHRVDTNLLRGPAIVRGGTLKAATQATAITLSITPGAGPAEVTIPFDPRITPTCVLPNDWTADGAFAAPFILNAPDFGPMLVTQTAGAKITGQLHGSRNDHFVNLIITAPPSSVSATLQIQPLLLPPPGAGVDPEMWSQARRGWLNAIQPCAQWGEQGRPFSAPAGILGNNVISDPASSSLWFYADQIFFIPQPAPGISLLPTLRRTIEYWIDQKMVRDSAGKETGEIICYWDYTHFLDANAGPLIASWDYVQASGDRAWLAKKIARLEMVADFLITRDVDNDGLIEATQSGNAGTLVNPARSCAWWDALNCGHKDAYTNALIYRAFRCLADLESHLKRDEAAAKYGERADRLKAAYFKTLFNPQSGLLAWWKSADGKLHDFASPTTNGLAIEYGLVPPQEAKGIVDRLWKKIDEVKFTRLDLGVPPMLTPVPHGDYLLPESIIGSPTRADGTDTFGIYMNGGITAGQVLHFIDANYLAGDTARGDKLLRAMLERQIRGEFQNGVVNDAMKGIDWTTWDGKPSGYEGYLADSFRFLQAVLLRDPATRQTLLAPLSKER